MLNVACRQFWFSDEGFHSRSMHLIFLSLNGQIYKLNNSAQTI